MFLSTGRVGPGDHLLSEQLTVFDRTPISYCDSLTKTEELKEILQSKHLPERCDNSIDDIVESFHGITKYINRTVCKFSKIIFHFLWDVDCILVSDCATKTNYSYTLDVVQRRRGCTQSADGTVCAFETWAVNGMDFLSFDSESQRWTSLSPSAITVQHPWNNNKARNIAFKHFIREQCPQMIQGIKLRSTPQTTGESWSCQILSRYTH